MAKPEYQGSWPEQARRQIATEPQCAWCGTTSDLCADHLVPKRPELGVRTLCRPCNTRRVHGATGPR